MEYPSNVRNCLPNLFYSSYVLQYIAGPLFRVIGGGFKINSYFERERSFYDAGFVPPAVPNKKPTESGHLRLKRTCPEHRSLPILLWICSLPEAQNAFVNKSLSRNFVECLYLSTSGLLVGLI
ncbi:hypothetical protein CEXT_190201 [Caerostris extrusa]|uniref:Uncharacterized protein n=1 Tax=Caerostris extrusa TaxID=172846 RepID=A0AAV4RIP3_CAEEX|nr:hypothetical protein CEXT_190201 [Caerostris extrusa]